MRETDLGEIRRALGPTEFPSWMCASRWEYVDGHVPGGQSAHATTRPKIPPGVKW
ncbi:hypothetical protein SAMN04490239_9355 [Rhodococcus koreensis]|uniref:Uncharacterized protein n=1 Tax=Rhodococcus koreensis TaxID=99653 RepID=A0A1H5ETJ4_9NOCA|nr:hypothetical protein SAMN04490239_9355 [Rhodococcus koreensis]